MWQRMKKTEAYRYDDGLFHVTEIFDSIDGEGKRTGLMAIFVRLAGCNLRCSYCDTAYSLSLTDTAEVPYTSLMCRTNCRQTVLPTRNVCWMQRE